MSNVNNITSDNFESAVLGSKLPTLVDFWAPWCGPCKAIAPTLDQLSAEYSGKINVVKVNIEDEPEFAEKFGIMSIPTLIIFKDGKESEKKVGALSKENLVQFIENSL